LGNQTITLAPPLPLQVTDVIADQTGSGGTGSNAGAGTIVIDGTSSVSFQAANTYTGGTIIENGEFDLGNAAAAGTGAITFAPVASGTATLGLSGFAPKNTIKGFTSSSDTISFGRGGAVPPALSWAPIMC
jgi:autotransporter-associated beta strand protein